VMVQLAGVAAAREALALAAAAAAAVAVAVVSSPVALLIENARVLVAWVPVGQRALPALAVADIDVVKRREMRCYIGRPKVQCLPCFGSVRARVLHIWVAVGYLAAIGLVQTEPTFEVLYLLSFLAALVPAEEASIRHCLTEGWKECLVQGLEVPFLMVWAQLWGFRSSRAHS
jgi:hypothetical protein